VFFDTLLNPTEFVVWKIDPSRHNLIASFRSLASYLNEKCCWRDIDILQKLEKYGSPELRNLNSKLEGQLSRIKNRNEKLNKAADTQEKNSLLDAVKLAKRRQIFITKNIEKEKRRICSLKDNLINKINKAIPPLEAIYNWNGASISRYSIVDIGGIWSSTITVVTNYRDPEEDLVFKKTLKAMECSVSTINIYGGKIGDVIAGSKNIQVNRDYVEQQINDHPSI
jgi:hypothetical protein